MFSCAFYVKNEFIISTQPIKIFVLLLVFISQQGFRLGRTIYTVGPVKTIMSLMETKV